jgi:putative oxidoreductase
MIVASSMHIDNGFFSSNGGFEFPGVLGLTAAALALTGPGTLSIDHVLGHRLNQPWMRSLALAAVVPAALTVIARRRRAVAAAAEDISTPAEPEAAAPAPANGQPA